jgi:hypothetical protein
MCVCVRARARVHVLPISYLDDEKILVSNLFVLNNLSPCAVDLSGIHTCWTEFLTPLRKHLGETV